MACKFLNLGNRIASCDDNFLLLGANCKEDHPATIRYATQIRGEIPRFKFSLAPDLDC